MKHGKKPTVKQSEFLRGKRLNPSDWLIVKDTPDEIHIVHRFFNNARRTYSKRMEE